MARAKWTIALAMVAGLLFINDGYGKNARGPRGLDGARIAAAAEEPQNWLMAAGDYREQRFSPLTQINEGTVQHLNLAWSYDIPTQLGQEATPVVVDGVIYVSTDGSIVKALDAKTGKLLWSYDPAALPQLVVACCGPVNRGVAVWKKRVYVGTLDGRLVALDAATGKPVWDVLTVDRTMSYTITGVPRIVNGKVIIGNGGAEFGVRGYVTAYDAETGKQLWRFYTVPGDPKIPDHAASDDVMAEKARATWTGEYWKLGGGGTVWDAMAYDAELNLLYIGCGNGSPWNAGLRSPGGGDNLFLSSIVALNPDTGKYVWHYQETPAEAWDFTATQSIILADLKIGGRMRQVLMQAPKNGFFYVLDRKTGELLSAEKYAPVNWASGIDIKTGRPIENPEARYYKTNKSAVVIPGSSGAHNWMPMAFSPRTGLAYIPAQNLPAVFAPDSIEHHDAKKLNVGVAVDGSVAPSAAALDRKIIYGWLSAWDPVQQKEIWRVPHANFWNGGILATAGDLVFQGDANAQLVAYGAKDGKRLWAFDTQTGVVAAPMSYAVDGEQYIAVMAGWAGVWSFMGGGVPDVTGKEAGRNRLLVFKLGGTAKLAAAPPPPVKPFIVTEVPPPASADRGASLYSQYCFRCHGMGVVGGHVTPDLRSSPAVAEKDSFAAVLVEGVLQNRGMASFGEQIGGAAGAEDIRAFIARRAREAAAAASPH